MGPTRFPEVAWTRKEMTMSKKFSVMNDIVKHGLADGNKLNDVVNQVSYRMCSLFVDKLRKAGIKVDKNNKDDLVQCCLFANIDLLVIKWHGKYVRLWADIEAIALSADDDVEKSIKFIPIDDSYPNMSEIKKTFDEISKTAVGKELKVISPRPKELKN